jgi:predicted nucleotidyltransferase
MEPVIEQNIGKLAGLCQRHHVRRLDVFGSASEGSFSSLSDIDFVVEFDDGVAGDRFDNYFHLLEELRKLFGRNIDLIEPGGLQNPYFIKRVQQTRRPVYVAS